MKHFLTILLLSVSITVSATTYYVSATGNDSNSGLTEVLAWQSLDKVNAQTFSAGDQILFKRGDTWYGKLIINQSGSSGNLITISAYGFGDDPIITGLATISGWTDLGSNVWESSSAVSTLPTLKLVLINGVNTPMGRYPNGNSSYPYLPNFFNFQSHTGTGSGATTITSSSLDDGFNWNGADIVVRVNQYTLDRAVITGDAGTTLSYTGEAGTLVDGWGFFIQNDTKTLDQQGEWYFDPSTKKIRIYSTGEPDNVQVTTIDTLLYTGSRQYIKIKNINFIGANTSAIVMPGGSYSVIDSCEISYTGDIAVDIYGTLTSPSVTNTTIENCGSSAIWGRGYTFTITGNTIKNAGIVSPYKPNDYTYGAIAITSPSSPDANHLIQYNQIDSCDYNGIQFRGAGVQVRNNYINYPCLLRGDGGGIYTGFANETGKVIDGNIVLNSKGNYSGIKSGSGKDAHGIYIDDLGNNMTITNNTIAGCSNSGLFLHNAKNITVKNNNIYDNGGSDYTKGQIFIQNGSGTSYDSYARGNVIKGNILTAKNTNQYAVFYDAANNTNLIQDYGVFDSNYYAKPDANLLQLNQTGNSYSIMNLSSWKSTIGQDENSKQKFVNTDSLLLLYNSTNQDSTITLSQEYLDVENTLYSGSITLSAYSSKVLIQNGGTQTANAGEDKTLYMSDASYVILDGSASTGSVTWTEISTDFNSGGTIESPTSKETLLSGLVKQGTFYFKITSGSSSDTMVVRVEGNEPPVNGTIYREFDMTDPTVYEPINDRSDTTGYYPTGGPKASAGTEPNRFYLFRDRLPNMEIDAQKSKLLNQNVDGYAGEEGVAGNYPRTELQLCDACFRFDTTKTYMFEWKGYFPQNTNWMQIDGDPDWAALLVIWQTHGFKYDYAIANFELTQDGTINFVNEITGDTTELSDTYTQEKVQVGTLDSFYNKSQTIRVTMREGLSDSAFIKVEVNGIQRYYRQGRVGSAFFDDYVKFGGIYDWRSWMTNGDSISRGRRWGLVTESFKVYQLSVEGTIAPPAVEIILPHSDTTIYLGSSVTLNGNVESAFGHTSTYLWSIESGTGTLDDATALNTSVSDLGLGVNKIRLTATQDDDQESYGERNITVIPIPEPSQIWILKGPKKVFINSN